MIKMTSWTLFLIALTCSAGITADIRRVVTALDATDKAIALFDSRLTLDPGNTGSPSAALWTTDPAPAGLPLKDDNAAKSLPALPPDARTPLLMVEFPPIDASTEAEMHPNFRNKANGQ